MKPWNYMAAVAAAILLITVIASVLPVSEAGTGVYGAYAYSTSPDAPNITMYVPLDSVNATSLPDMTVVIYGSVNYTVMLGNRTVQTGFTPTTVRINFTLPANGTDNITIIIAGLVYGTIRDLHVESFASFSNVQGVYIVSTYPGQSQQLYAAPGQSNILMYPYWNITMYSSANVSYSVYVDGSFVSAGHFAGQKVVRVYVNASMASAVVGLGHTVYNFTDMPISSVPLRTYYSPPGPKLIFSAAYIEDILAKAAIGSILGLLAAIFIAGKLEAARKERTVTY